MKKYPEQQNGLLEVAHFAFDQPPCVPHQTIGITGYVATLRNFRPFGAQPQHRVGAGVLVVRSRHPHELTTL